MKRTDLIKKKIEFEEDEVIKNQNNVGRIQNWNVCIDNAQGDYLVYLFILVSINEPV